MTLRVSPGPRALFFIDAANGEAGAGRTLVLRPPPSRWSESQVPYPPLSPPPTVFGLHLPGGKTGWSRALAPRPLGEIGWLKFRCLEVLLTVKED